MSEEIKLVGLPAAQEIGKEIEMQAVLVTDGLGRWFVMQVPDGSNSLTRKFSALARNQIDNATDVQKIGKHNGGLYLATFRVEDRRPSELDAPVITSLTPLEVTVQVSDRFRAHIEAFMRGGDVCDCLIALGQVNYWFLSSVREYLKKKYIPVDRSAPLFEQFVQLLQVLEDPPFEEKYNYCQDCGLPLTGLWEAVREQKRVCTYCFGTGICRGETCPYCDGSRYIEWEHQEEDDE